MSDKLRRSFPLAIKFAPGEQPSAAKLSGLSTQARNAFSLLESVIGDTWNQAGDLILSPLSAPTLNALHIPNISRSIGKMSLLNSMLPGLLSSDMLYIDPVGANYPGQNRAYLTYKPSQTPSNTTIVLSGTFSPLVQGQFDANPANVISTGDWSVDTSGRMYTFDPIPSTLTLTYKPTVTPDVASLNGNVASWNVIPDPTTWSGNYAGVKISFANNVDSSSGYHIWLPPRKPLDSSKTLTQSPVTTGGNTASDAESGGPYFFQSDSINASTNFADHYRYGFPVELTGVGGANDALPSGFIYIWDEDTGTIVEGGTFYVPGNTAHRKFKVRVTGTNIETVFGDTIGNGIVTDDTTQIPGDYKIRFKIITVGASVAKTLSYLNKNFWSHSHKLAEGGVPISHSDLDDLITPAWNSTYNPLYPSGIQAFRKIASWQNDDHLQYLHRGGSTLNGSTKRDYDDNAIYRLLTIKSPYTAPQTGALFLGADDSGTVARISTSAATALLLQGSDSAAGNLYKTQVNSKLYFRSSESPSATLQGNYIHFNDGVYDFYTDNSISNSWINVGVVFAESLLGSLVTTETTYDYSTPRTQYLHISPMDVIIPSTFTDLNQDSQRLFNNSTSDTYQVYVPVRFPDGAILPTSLGGRFWHTGNGTNGVTFALLRYTKPTSNGWVNFASSAVIVSTETAASTTNAITELFYANDSVVDNHYSTGSYHLLQISFPIKISSNQPAFWGVSFRYQMSEINN
jgi:hypothetical protein